jgi:hypothetical protein
MVDFPEGYGFAPATKGKLMQEKFTLVIGTYSRRNPYCKPSRKTSPYEFTEVAVVKKEAHEAPIRGILLGSEMTAPIEGNIQQVVTALCTLHRMKGNIK